MAIKFFFKIFSLILFCTNFVSQQINSITLVYSLKIRRQFSLASEGKQKESKYVTTALPIIDKFEWHVVDENFATDVCEKRLIGGSVFNFRYVSAKSWWLEATTGFEKETVKSKGTAIFDKSRTGFDDIVLSVGYNMFPAKNMQFVLYGIGGVPTRKEVTIFDAEDTLVGTRFYSVGAGAEFSYSIINTLPESLIVIFQGRFLHFFDRKWFPILPPDAKIQPGNVSDLLVVLQYRKNKNIFEVGYNPTFYANEAYLLDTGKINIPDYTRQSIYTSFSHLYEEFPIINKPGLIGAGFNIGWSKRYSIKILSFWVNFSLSF